MIPLFLGITLANLIGLGVATTLGYLAISGSSLGQWHRLAGALAAILCCATHCIVFTYFVATAKWVQHAIAVKSLDPLLAAPTRSFKAQAFPAALLAIGMMLLAAFAGAAVDNGLLGSPWHHYTALAMLAVNVLSAVIELRAIRRNGALIDQVLARVNGGV